MVETQGSVLYNAKLLAKTGDMARFLGCFSRKIALPSEVPKKRITTSLIGPILEQVRLSLANGFLIDQTVVLTISLIPVVAVAETIYNTSLKSIGKALG